MKRLRANPIAMIVMIAAGHLAVTWAVGVLTLSGGITAATGPQGPATITRLLVSLTRVLHFPIITLALYPRQLFPGPWILIPMAVNSLLWGIAVYWILRIGFKMGR